MIETKSHRFDVQGMSVRVLCAGAGDSSVLLLHGGGIDSAALSWEEALPALAGNHRVFAADWPGYGESDRPDAPYSMEYYITFLPALMDALGVQKASLVGLSMGGGIALGFTLEQPQRVEKLVLVSSYGLQSTVAGHQISYLYLRLPGLNDFAFSMMRSSHKMIRLSLQAILHNPEAITDDLVEKAYTEAHKPQAARAFGVFQTSEMLWKRVRTCYMDRLPEVSQPTLLVHGAQDTRVPVENARRAHELIRGSRLHIMDGCGHWPQREKPAEFNGVVSEFLK